MNRPLQLLIAVACVAIVAAVGYYFWGEYSRAAAVAERAAGRERVRQELFEFSKAPPGDAAAVRRWCEAMDGRLDRDLKDNEVARQLVSNCRALDYL